MANYQLMTKTGATPIVAFLSCHSFVIRLPRRSRAKAGHSSFLI
jgi:hypothetical protein